MNEMVNDSTGGPQALTAMVAEILGVDQQKLEDVFSQAITEMPNGAMTPGPPNVTQ